MSRNTLEKYTLAKYANKQASQPLPLILNKFGSESPSSQGNNDAAYMRNFRIDKNGRLVKRYGYKLLHEFENDIRGVWQGLLGGRKRLIIAAGDTLFELEGNTSVPIAQLGSDSGRTLLFYMGDRLYISDGNDYMSYDGTNFASVEGYIPIISKNGRPNYEGDPYMKRNMLTRKVKKLFHSNTGTYIFPFTADVEQVFEVKLNGVTFTDYTVSYGDKTVVTFLSAPTVMGENKVEITYILNEDNLRQQLINCLYCSSYESGGKTTLFLYGSSDISTIYYSESEGESSTAEYFAEDNILRAGDGRRAVTSIIRQYDKLLVFTEKGVYITEASDYVTDLNVSRRRFPLYTINSSIGNIGYENARQTEDDTPISVTMSGVYRWLSNSLQGERSASLISSDIDSLLTPDFLSRATSFLLQADSEFWLACDGIIRVYNYRLNKWYSFDGIDSDSFIDIGVPAFIKGSKLFVFKRQSFDDDGKKILAVYESGYIDFDTPHLTKKLHRVFVVVDDGGRDAEVELIPDGCRGRSHRLNGAGNPHIARIRPSLPRFTFLRFRLTDDSAMPFALRGVALRFLSGAEAKGS